jgi:DNA polymerase alpha subunit B
VSERLAVQSLVDGVRITACTQDVLRHLSAAEAAREPASGAAGAGAGPSDRMSRLAAHLPGQRSAYPLFPPAAVGLYKLNSVDP